VATSRLVLFFIVCVDMLGFSLLFPLFPSTILHYLSNANDSSFGFLFSFAESFGEGNSKTTYVLFGGLLGSIYSGLQFVFGPIWGKLSDSLGRKKVLLWTTLGTVMGNVFWLFSSSFSLFLVSRFLLGTMGGNLSVAQASMADLTDEKNRARGMGLLGAGIGLGFVLGPVLGGITSGLPYLQEWTNSGFLVVHPCTPLFALFVSSINFCLVVWMPEIPQSLSSNSRKSLHPIFGFFESKKELKSLSILFFLFSLAFSGFEFTLNFFMADRFGFDPALIGYTFLYIGLIIIFTQGGIVRRLSGKVSEKNIATYGSYALLIGFLGLLIAESKFSFYMSLTFLSLGSALVNPGLASLVSLLSEKTEQGLRMGQFRSFSSLARAVSPILYGTIYFKLEPSACFALSTLLIFIFLIFLVRFKETPRVANEAKET